jgi:phytoene dehydrogenase-like protein
VVLVRFLRDSQAADVVVVGGGPNGLVCANYLASAGLEVAVVEAGPRLGGGLKTEELTLPLFRHNPHAFFMRWTPAYRLWSDLQLGDTGVRMITPDKQNALPTREGRTLVTYTDPARTLDGIQAFDAGDARRFAAFLEESRRLSRTVIEPLRFSPPMAADEMEEALRGSADGRRFLEIARPSALDLVRELFRTEQLRALVLFASALRGYLPVLDVPGTGYVVAQAVAGLLDCALVEGGSYQLARAMATRLYQHGGWALTGDPVAEIAVRAGRARGVALASGGFVAARRAVVSNVPAALTLPRLVGREHLDRSLVETLEAYPWNGEALMGVHLALRRPPSFGDVEDGCGALNLCLGYETSQDVERDMLEVRAGSLPSAVALHASVPTRFDPGQAPPGMHTAFGWQFVPSRPGGDDASFWSAAACDRQLAAMVDTWVRYAPNVQDAEIARAAHSPLHTQELVPSMWLGDRHHGSYHPDNYFDRRPCPELSAYRTPIDGLYLCGSSSHPGGSVNGIGGYNAAGVIAEDLGLDRWWRPVHARHVLSSLAGV